MASRHADRAGEEATRRDSPMDTIKTLEHIDQPRRRLFGAAAVTIAAAEFGLAGIANVSPPARRDRASARSRPGTYTSSRR